MKFTVFVRAAAVLAIFGLTASASHSASGIFFSPTTASASSSDLPGAVATNLIDGSGLSVTPVTLDNIATVFHSDGGIANTWRGSAYALPITLTFGFASPVEIGYVGLWQGIRIREGTREFDLTFWTDINGSGNQVGGIYSNILDSGALGDNSISLNGHAFDVGARAGVSSVIMHIISVAHPINPHVHLGEFMVASSVPEPSTMLLLALGIFAVSSYSSFRTRLWKHL